MAGRTSQESEKIMERVEEFNSTGQKDKKIKNNCLERDFNNFHVYPYPYPGRLNVIDFENYYPTLIKLTGHCAICYSHLIKEFPEDYPNEWKFCCSCLDWANRLIGENFISKEHLLRSKILSGRGLLFSKIYYKITLVGK